MDEAIDNVARQIHGLFCEWLRTEGADAKWPNQANAGPFDKIHESRKTVYRFIARGILKNLPIIDVMPIPAAKGES